MFAAAYAIARQFTFPVIVSRITKSGQCTAGLGAFVLLNEDGWIITAAHIVALYAELSASRQNLLDYDAAVSAITGDAKLSANEKKRKLRKLSRPRDDTVQDYSFWWSADGVSLVDVKGMQGPDVAIGRLTPFKGQPNAVYPVFKDPSKDIRNGTSLCRLGFPFYDVQPTYANGSFSLPPGTFPIPLFPNEGIFTRAVMLGKSASGYSLGFLETSSPGLKGQSGGPIFDQHGTVWAIQSQTRNLPLGFSPPVPGGKPTQVEHQFLNVGWGTHPETIVGFLQEHGISHSLSAY